MPFIPNEHAFPKVPKELLRNIDIFAGEPQFWEDVRDNIRPWSRPDLNPNLAPIRPGFGYKVRAYYKSPSGDVEVFREAQGQVVAVSTPSDGRGAGYAQINLTELGHNRVVPLAILQGGNVHIKDRTSNVTSFLDPNVSAVVARNNAKPPDQLSMAILTFLSTLAGSDFMYLTANFFDLVGGPRAQKGAEITRMFVEGVKKAGLLKTLNKPDFDVTEIQQKATKVHSSSSGGGMYIRIVGHANSTSKDCYIGRTNNFGRREIEYRKEINNPEMKRPHIKACRNAKSVEMYVLCYLPEDTKGKIVSIAEQTFVSLFESYLPTYLEPGKALDNAIIAEAFGQDNPDTVMDRGTLNRLAAFRLHGIANAAKTLSDWPGFATRPSSGVSRGHNVESPLLEHAEYERIPWIRRDTFMPDKNNTNKRIPIAIFRRTIPSIVHWVVTGGNEKLYIADSLKWTPLSVRSSPRDGQDKRWIDVPVVTITGHKLPDGEDYPKEGDEAELVFEVRLDGERHPTALCGLPLIGIFEDWNRAMSVAFRYEWKAPSGLWKRCYLAKRVVKGEHPEVRGSLGNYVTGMAFVRWLLREIPDQHTLNRIWMHSLPPIKVFQLRIDFLRQDIQINTPPIQQALLSSARLDDASIERIMSQSKWMLGRLGATPKHALITDTTLNPPGTLKPRWTVGLSGRSKCDQCLFQPKRPCVLVPGKEVCELCYYTYGRPKCTWTVGVAKTTGLQSYCDMDARFKQVQECIKAAICIAPIDESKVTAGLGTDPKLQKITVSEEEDENEIMGESEEDEDESMVESEEA